MNPLVLIFVIPIISGVLGYLIYRLRNEFNFLGTILTLYYALSLFIATRKTQVLSHDLFALNNINFSFYLDQFSGIFILGIAVISFIILLYSFRYMRGFKHISSYYLYFMLTIAVANGLIISNNLILLLFFSFLLTTLLYLFLFVSSGKSLIAANQIFLVNILFNIIISLGISLLLFQTGNASITINPQIIPTTTPLILAFFLILIGIIGKIGIIPLHFWTSKLIKTPVTIMTFIPMTLDKIIGIYLLFRLSYYIFNINQVLLIRLIILAIGGISIIYAGLLAIKTKEVYQLLNYNAIIQLGFIFIGIGCANPFGFAGGILHSLNYLTFQPSLLLTSGSVEYWTKTATLDNFEGLASKMPITFFTLVIVSLSCAGVPPLNGFFSKWLLFQGILKMNGTGFNIISLLFTIVAVLGVIFTFVYLFRLLYAFQGTKTKYSQRIRDPGFTMSFSPIILSILCIILGIFANSLSWQTITLPSTNTIFPNLTNINPWTFGPALILLIISLLIGAIIYYYKLYQNRLRSA